jgi:hypothetical protein
MNREWLLWIGLAALAIAATGTGVYVMTRGIRNNNPGNIRHGDNWQGMDAVQPDQSFITFTSPEWGIRAMTRILRNYQRRHGLYTIREIISRWAPPEDNNDTESYIAHVSRVLGIGPDEQLFVDDHMVPLIKTIIKHENGTQPYSDGQIAKGIQLA